MTEILGRYEILEELSPGSAGRILLARDPQTGRRVLIKLLQFLGRLPRDQRAEAAERLLHELQAVRRLSHPGIVALLDTDEVEGRPYLVTEFVEGTSFDAYCAPDGLLAEDSVIELVVRAAEALDHAHRSGVVHGDLRPANLLHVGEAGVKIENFGLASASTAGPGGPEVPPGYASPESIRGVRLDGRSDLFSLGAVLYEMLTGEKAFPGDSVSSVLYRIVNESPRDPEQLGVRPALCEFLRRALAKQPEERFESAAQFAKALGRAAVERGADRSIGSAVPEAAQLSDMETPPPAQRPEKAAPRSSTRPFILGAILVVVVGAAALVLLKGGVGERGAPLWETQVRTEPPDLEVQLDGVPLDPLQGGLVQYRGAEPFGVLSAAFGCRNVEHRLSPEDAGGELVLVLDPVELDVQVDPAVSGASIRVNDESAGTTPADLHLDLCRDNRIELRAEGFRPASIEIPAGAKPLDARKLLYGMSLEPIPKGRLVLPRKKQIQLVFYVDGRRVASDVQELELEEGRHKLRYKNEYHWIDVTLNVDVGGDETAKPRIDVPLTRLVVQAYPANCKVYLRRPGGRWRYMDETPTERRVATGRYEVKVELNPTGETRVKTVELVEGTNPPVRVSFGGRG